MPLRPDRRNQTAEMGQGLSKDSGIREACGEAANQVTYLQNTVKELQHKIKELEGEVLSLYRRLDANF